MSNVLIITYSMIPHATSWGGCQRMYYLAEQLVFHGYEVTVMCCDNPINDYLGKSTHFKSMPLKVNNAFARGFLSQKKNVSAKAKESKSPKLSLFSLKKLIKNSTFMIRVLSLIDRKIYNEPGVITGYISTHWCIENYKYIRAYIVENKICNVIVSGPPFGMFRIIKMLKTDLQDVNVIMDYRDPWNLWKKGSKLTCKKESEALKNADAITCTNQYIKDALTDSFHVDAGKVHVIANGFNASDWPDDKWEHIQSDDVFKMVYTGAISFGDSPYRDATQLLRALCHLKKEGRHFVAIFVGIDVTSNENNVYVKELGDNIKLLNPMPNTQAISYVQSADLAILLHTAIDDSGRYLISGKMYDYIRCKVPIIAIGRQDNAHAKMIQEFSIGVNAENNEHSIYEAINSIYNLWEAKILCSTYDYSAIQDITMFSRENQNKLIESILMQ